jgi:hypothetical protein
MLTNKKQGNLEYISLELTIHDITSQIHLVRQSLQGAIWNIPPRTKTDKSAGLVLSRIIVSCHVLASQKLQFIFRCTRSLLK